MKQLLQIVIIPDRTVAFVPLLAPIIELQLEYPTILLLPLFDIIVSKQFPEASLKAASDISVLQLVGLKVKSGDAVIPRLFEHPNAILPEFTAAPVIVESHLQNTSLEVQSQTSTLDIEFELLAVAILSFGT